MANNMELGTLWRFRNLRGANYNGGILKTGQENIAIDDDFDDTLVELFER